jgi:prepilin-type N-terminal cleavage/methylation domain-containing protein
MRQSIRKQGGFTIIEMLIVLGIVSLILSMVLLALPALTRNSHNSTRRDDVHMILSAVSAYGLNHGGNFPDELLNFPDGTYGDSAAFLRATTKLSYYDISNITLRNPGAPGVDESSISVDLDHVTIFNYQKCDPSAPGKPTRLGAGYNDVVAIFSIETSSGRAQQCAQL